jgi:signal transduction histidine kinase
MERITQSTLFQRFWDFAGAASIRVKVLGIVLGVILLLGTFIMVQMRSAVYQTLTYEMEHQGEAIADSVAGELGEILDGNVDLMQHVVRGNRIHYSSAEHNTLIDYIIFDDANGEPVVESYADYVDSALVHSVEPTGITADGWRYSLPWGDVTEVRTEVQGGRGLVRVGLSDANVQATLTAVTLQIVSITLVMIGVGLAAAYFLTWILTRPIFDLVEATEAVARGELDRQVPRWANDEIGDLAMSFNAMTRALAQADRERAEREALREKYIRGVIQAQEDERKRIARELHDSTSQSLTSLLVGLRNLAEVAPDTLETQIEDIRQVVSGTLEEVHALAWQLRPSVLDDLGLVVALGRYIADLERRFNLQIDFTVHGLGDRLPVTLETSLYRMTQEGLTNVARHAHAEHASVLIDQRNSVIRLIIEDDGVGFDPGAPVFGEKHLGVQGIRERAQLLGGKLTIESQPGQGTSLFIEIPLNSAAEPRELERSS